MKNSKNKKSKLPCTEFMCLPDGTVMDIHEYDRLYPDYGLAFRKYIQ